MTIVAQIIGIVAMCFNIAAFQFKKSKNLLIIIGIGSLLFAINYTMLGSFASAGYNILSIIRSSAIINKKTHNNIFFAFMMLLYTAMAVFTYAGPWSIVLFLTQPLQSYAMWYKDGGFLRKAQIFFISPIWLINNIFFAFTIGGIVCESFMIISAIVSFIRYGKDFDKA